MSKRSSHCRSTNVLFSAVAALSLLLGTFTTLRADATSPIVQISIVHNAPLGDYVYVDITLDNLPGQPGFGGYDFLIAYDASVLTFSFLSAGTLLDSCAWEYFSYRYGAFGDCGGPCPSGMLRLVALAETNNGNVHPTCYLEGMSGKLATIKFFVANVPNYECQFIPIRFGWLDCGDNSMTSPSGGSRYISEKVFDFQNTGPRTDPNYDITGVDCGQPFHYGGTCAECDSVSGVSRRLLFWNGGIDIACSDSIDQRGDINLNGLANEIADLVMFDNYFMHGYSAFPSWGWMASIAASDVNADGIPLSFRDVVYLLRIIIGDAQPFPKLPAADSLNAYFYQDTTNHQVEVTYSGNLAGAFMLIRGNVTPTFLVPFAFDQTYFFDGTHTRILILGDQPENGYGSGVWFTYQGTGTLTYVETTDWHDTNVLTYITGTSNICGDINGSGDIDITDAVYIIRYIFSGGQPPFGGQSGDLNCDTICDISDAVYSMQYIFAGGPAPCEGCK